MLTSEEREFLNQVATDVARGVAGYTVPELLALVQRLATECETCEELRFELEQRLDAERKRFELYRMVH